MKETRTIIVEPGDTLGHIALECLGDANRWNEIWDANYQTICTEQRRQGVPKPGSPHMIYAGMALVVPAEES